jgi:hypothetical protein
VSFKTTDYLIFKQNKKELDNELLSEFNPYLTTKTFSFYDPSLVDYINDTLNTYGNIFKSREDQFKFFENVIPKQKPRRINYIKKNKAEKVEITPIPEFYSKREIDMFKDLNKYLYE